MLVQERGKGRAMRVRNRLTSESLFGSASRRRCVRFDVLSEPGCYVCEWSGHLLRVPEDYIRQGLSSRMMLAGPRPLLLCKISDDPFHSIAEARLLAANLDLRVNF